MAGDCPGVYLFVCNPPSLKSIAIPIVKLVSEREQEGTKLLWAIMSAQRDPVDLNKQ